MGDMQDVGLRAKIDGMGAFVRNAQQIDRQVQSLGQRMSQVARESVSAGKGFGSFLDPLGKLGFAIFGVQQLTSAVQGLGNAILGPSTQWEEFGLQFEVLLGSADKAEAKLDELSKFASKTPFTLPEVTTQAESLLGWGFSAEKLTKTLTTLGDVASGVGREKLPRIIAALGQMRTKGKVTAEEMGQLVEAQVPAWQILADSIGAPVGRLQELVSDGVIPADQAIDALLSGMDRKYGGLMDKMSRGLSGMLSNLDDWWGTARRIAGEGLFEGAKTSLEGLLSVLNSADTQQGLYELGRGIGDLTAEAIKIGRDALPGVQDFASAIKDAATATGTLVQAWKEFDKQEKAKGKKGGFSSALGLEPMPVDKATLLPGQEALLEWRDAATTRLKASLNPAGASALIVKLWDFKDANAELDKIIEKKDKASSKPAELAGMFNLPGVAPFKDWERSSDELASSLDVAHTKQAQIASAAELSLRQFIATNAELIRTPGVLDAVISKVGVDLAEKLGLVDKKLAAIIRTLSGATKNPFTFAIKIAADFDDYTSLLPQAIQKATPRKGIFGIATDFAENAGAINDIMRQFGANSSSALNGISLGSATASAALKGLQRDVSNTEEALNELEAAVERFSNPRLIGMQAAEDELFSLEMAIKQARLEELGLGDTAVNTNAKIEDSFDLLAAQQREIAEGIPVALQKYEHDVQRLQREAANAPSQSDQGESEAARKVRELERLHEAMQLRFDLTFEPQLRRLRETAEDLKGENKEITFQEAYQGLVRTWGQAETLRGTLVDQKAALEAQQEVMDSIKTASSGILSNETLTTAEKQTQLDLATKLFGIMKDTVNLPTPTPPPLMSGNSRRGGPIEGFADGGIVGSGGVVKVGERGSELAVLPAGTRVLPHSALQAASVTRNYADYFTINGATQPINVAMAVRRELRFQKITQGR